MWRHGISWYGMSWDVMACSRPWFELTPSADRRRQSLHKAQDARGRPDHQRKKRERSSRPGIGSLLEMVWKRASHEQISLILSWGKGSSQMCGGKSHGLAGAFPMRCADGSS